MKKIFLLLILFSFIFSSCDERINGLELTIIEIEKRNGLLDNSEGDVLIRNLEDADIQICLYYVEDLSGKSFYFLERCGKFQIGDKIYFSKHIKGQ